MFRGWGFLLGEIWILIALAALLGLFIGWLIWGRRSVNVDNGEAERLRAELDACHSRGRECAQRVSQLEADLAAAQAAAVVVEENVEQAVSEPEVAPEPVPEPEATPEPAVAAEPEAVVADEPAAEDIGTKPSTLDAPRAGQPDDLKRIKGIGPKLEGLCNRLGFWHFDQIANWTDEEIAWVDVNLESFKGRVTRDNWVAQARELAAENG